MLIRNLQGSTLMIALSLGYIVLVLAKKEQKNLKKIGYLIGIFVIAVCSVLLIAKTLWTVKNFKSACYKPMGQYSPYGSALEK